MTTVRILEPRDQPALEAFCLPRVATSMFLLSNSRVAGLADHSERYQATYAAAFDDAAMTGVVAHCWNKMLIPQAPDYLDELWRAAVRASGRGIGGALGPAEQVTAMVEAWRAEGSTLDVQLDQVEKLYVLPLDDLRVPEALRPASTRGQLLRGRRITAEDVELAICWTVAFDIEGLGEEDGPKLRESARVSVRRKLEDGHLWLVEARTEQEDWVPVALSGFNAALREAVQIGPVYTPPELRRRGYARAAVAASLLDARAEGVQTAILFTGEDNLPAQRAYTALGFRHVGAFRLVLLRTPIANQPQHAPAFDARAIGTQPATPPDQSVVRQSLQSFVVCA